LGFSVAETESPTAKESNMPLLWLIVLILVILAVAGGVTISSFIWLLLIAALIVAVFAMMSGRRV
jgi:uncharacterized membrane protein